MEIRELTWEQLKRKMEMDEAEEKFVKAAEELEKAKMELEQALAGL